MTHLREHARGLRRRLNDHAIDIEWVANEAAMIFDAARSAVHMRWLELELKGYTSVEGQPALHEVLGVPAGDRLAVHVASYRLQLGQLVEGENTGKPFQHFFVEPLGQLVTAANQMQHRVPGQLHLGFGFSDVPGYPISGIFPSDVFDRMVLGFRAVLHLQLGSVFE